MRDDFVGSIWVEDYDFGTDQVRRVKVLSVAHDRVKIRTLADGSDTEFKAGSRETYCKLSRFGKSGGYKQPAPTPPEE